MCNRDHVHSHVCFIVPPKMLRRFISEAKGQEKVRLLAQLELSSFMRGQRSASGLAAPTLMVAMGQKRRTVFDLKGETRLPGTLARSEDGPASADATVNEAFEGAGVTYDFYEEVLQRRSIDGSGMRIDSSVHYDDHFNNAFWNGRQMVYGDGDGKFFNGFTKSIDIIAHELTHGVTQYTVPGGGLIYDGQSGALNESMSDIFGSVVKQWHLKQSVTQADWLIGDGIIMPKYGHALRSLARPGAQNVTWEGDDQPSSMTNYVKDGDVHTNSGIPNHAFYLAAMAIGGNSWDKAVKIWYQALGLLRPDSTFDDAMAATIKSAEILHGVNSTEAQAVKKGWQGAGF